MTRRRTPLNPAVVPAPEAAATGTRRSAVAARRRPPSAGPTRSAADVVAAERMLALLRVGADVRPAKVSRVRSSVSARTYENDLKLSIAVDRLAQDVPAEADRPAGPRRPTE